MYKKILFKVCFWSSDEAASQRVEMTFHDPDILPLLNTSLEKLRKISLEKLRKLSLDSDVPKIINFSTGEPEELQTPQPSSKHVRKQQLLKKCLNTPEKQQHSFDLPHGFQPQTEGQNQQGRQTFPSSSSTQEYELPGVPKELIDVESDRRLPGFEVFGFANKFSFSPSDVEQEPQSVQKRSARSKKSTCKISVNRKAASKVSESRIRKSSARQKTTSGASGESAGATNVDDDDDDDDDDWRKPFRDLCEMLRSSCEKALLTQEKLSSAFVLFTNVYPFYSRQCLFLAETSFIFATFSSRMLSVSKTLMNSTALAQIPDREPESFSVSFVKLGVAIPVLHYEFMQLFSHYVHVIQSDTNSSLAALRERFKERSVELHVNIICKQLDLASQLLTDVFLLLNASLNHAHQYASSSALEESWEVAKSMQQGNS